MPTSQAPSASAEVTAGTWLRNPITGEVAHVKVGPSETDGRRIEVDLWLQPGAAVPRAHIHDRLVERYEVRSGEVGFLVGSEERVAGPGDGTIEIPAGTVHDWWNAGDGIAEIRFELEGAPDAARPAARFLSLIETMWSLAALGQTNADGMPDPGWLAAIAHEFHDVLRFTTPPAAIQTVLLPPLAAIARRRGRDPLAPRLHGPSAPCTIADPGDGLAALLDQRVGAGAARGRG